MLDASAGSVAIEVDLENCGEIALAPLVDGLLHRRPREIPSRFLYDDRGSELFEQITALPEYYPTPTERGLLEGAGGEIAAASGAAELVELGPGSAAKTALLLEQLIAAGTLERYVPIDCSLAALEGAMPELARQFPAIELHGVVGDFASQLDRVPPPAGRRLVVLLGGTIGNFTGAGRHALLTSVRRLLGDDGAFLVGTSLVADPVVIEAAYNDAAGVTAAFNRNILLAVNRELDADFDPAEFEHVAFYDRRRRWIEMRLQARRSQSVPLRRLDAVLELAAGEQVRTEISARFSTGGIAAELAQAGMRVAHQYVDPQRLFALTLATTRC